MMLMIGFEVSVLIYILINEFDVTRFFFGIRAGIVLMAGIIVNVIFRKKFFPWIKYLNSIVIITAIYYLAGFSELITPLLILIPFINSFYFRPHFTLVTGLVCIFMMYICFMSIVVSLFNDNGEIVYNFFSIVRSSFDFSDESVVFIFQNR